MLVAISLLKQQQMNKMRLYGSKEVTKLGLFKIRKSIMQLIEFMYLYTLSDQGYKERLSGEMDKCWGLEMFLCQLST